jgi:hypothetical protein
VLPSAAVSTAAHRVASHMLWEEGIRPLALVYECCPIAAHSVSCTTAARARHFVLFLVSVARPPVAAKVFAAEFVHRDHIPRGMTWPRPDQPACGHRCACTWRHPSWGRIPVVAYWSPALPCSMMQDLFPPELALCTLLRSDDSCSPGYWVMLVTKTDSPTEDDRAHQLARPCTTCRCRQNSFSARGLNGLHLKTVAVPLVRCSYVFVFCPLFWGGHTDPCKVGNGHLPRTVFVLCSAYAWSCCVVLGTRSRHDSCL